MPVKGWRWVVKICRQPSPPNNVWGERRMRKIRVLLDYGAYPIWVFNEKGELVYTDLPDELRNETDI